MTKILTVKQIKALDEYTIQHEPIASIELMERACRAFTTWFTERFHALNKVGIVCGTGNNGGDGLGIARQLKAWGYPVKVWVVRGNMKESDDFKENFKRLAGYVVDLVNISSEADKGLFVECDVLIDAIFGSGLSRKPEGIYAQVIQCFNQATATKIAVDIPSGLMADQKSEEPIARVTYTLTFQLPKLAFLLPQSQQYIGEWTVLDIGLSKKFIKEVDTTNYLLTQKDIKRLIKPRSKFDHKGTFGHALLISGSFGKMGAAILSAKAALRSGVGLLTTHVPQCGYSIMQSSVPEAMAQVDDDDNRFTAYSNLESYNALGIGPGIGTHETSVKAFISVLKSFAKPVVIDADGLNILSAHSNKYEVVPPGSILTPHVKEFKRLVGEWSDDFERLEKQKELALQLRSVVLVKGAHSTVATPEGKLYFNGTGNPGMATGGTGDVLTGILTALLAQGYTAEDAARIGVYVHGFAGDLAASDKGMISLIASDLIEYLPAAFKLLSR
ncbi:NAD(P)H-hydrate dehydratase [Pseudochryseolinea flava]|uniref:Bifunctional NAD(P)H-hydrate repair enzyme n=1 Tax=Pseudochryseolinea flava TaxID=2059302 RepID=A0A364XVP2_9BACT|nr:NAD(P)H-hydrate dehydratase [Pseudochryseolinea flava]RAV98397.1 bifunctional ADP-dependent NAD(P)H-hydrate dehydratase/NAD(P)H-hydrate epimerase [Pseudochryseolinea flava]